MQVILKDCGTNKLHTVLLLLFFDCFRIKSLLASLAKALLVEDNDLRCSTFNNIYKIYWLPRLNGSVVLKQCISGVEKHIVITKPYRLGRKS